MALEMPSPVGTTIPTSDDSIMSGFSLEFTRDNFAVLRMQRGENRLNPEFVEQFSAALDKIESNSSCRALITIGEGRFFCNGLDYADSLHGHQISQWLKTLQKFHHRILTFPMPTVAAINGHSFGAGAFLALAHDFRVMNTGQCWICWEEILLGLQFIPYFLEMLRSKVPPSGQLQAAVHGQHFTAEAAVSSGIIDMVTRPETLLQDAIEIAKQSLGKQPYAPLLFENFKKDLYPNLVNLISQPVVMAQL